MGQDSDHTPISLRVQVKESRFKEFGAIDLHGLEERPKAGELVFSSALHYALTSQTHWVLGPIILFLPRKSDANRISWLK